MIVGLNGRVFYKEPNVVHVDVQGVIYEVFISLQTYAALEEKVYLHTTHVVREDAQLLYGFATKTEKTLFERLIKINGVGPKVAMAICSTYTPSQFATVINSNDMAGIKRVPGIGPKSAGRILVELNGFDATLLEDTNAVAPKTKAYAEATEALEALGFKKEQISQALSECSSEDTPSLVKEALKYLKTL
jgi:Holliday junction DNA helicase RuvA